MRVALTTRPDGTLHAHPVAGGSGDIVGFVRADGLVRIAAEDVELPARAVPVVVDAFDRARALTDGGDWLLWIQGQLDLYGPIGSI